MFYQIFLLSQLKQSAIISNKHGIYEFPHELPNDLRLRKAQENLRTSLKYNRVTSLPPKIKILLILAKDCSKIEIKTFPYFVNSHEN